MGWRWDGLGRPWDELGRTGEGRGGSRIAEIAGIPPQKANTGLFGGPGIPPPKANTGLFGDPGIPPPKANTGLFGDPGIARNRESQERQESVHRKKDAKR